MVFPELCLSAYAIDDLLFQDALLDAVEAKSPPRRGELQVVARLCRRRAAAGAGPSLQLRRRDPSRAACSGSCPKIYLPNYREFYERRHFTSGEEIARRDDRGRWTPGAVRHRSACSQRSGRRPASPFISRSARICGCRSRRATARRGGRRRDPAQPVGQQHHHRQGADAAAVMRLAIGALHRRLRLFGGRRRRIDDRPRLGRPGRDLRIGPRIWPRQSGFQLHPGDGRLPMSISAASGRSACAPTLLATARKATAATRPPFRTVAFDFAAPARKRLELRRDVERFPFVPADPAMLRDNCYEAYNIQVQGLAQRLKRDRARKAGDRRLGRARFDTGADRLGAGDGPARPATQQHPRLYACPALRPARRPRPMPGGS